jgi:hypothetical protein
MRLLQVEAKRQKAGWNFGTTEKAFGYLSSRLFKICFNNRGDPYGSVVALEGCLLKARGRKSRACLEGKNQSRFDLLYLACPPEPLHRPLEKTNF